MSKRKTERLLGLVVCLLSTRRYLTADQIRAAVPGYPEPDDLFKRMFERDKEDLRELGVPLETGLNHPLTTIRATGSAAGLRAARDPAGGGRGGRARLGRPGLAAGRAGRRRGGRAAEAAGGRIDAAWTVDEDPPPQGIEPQAGHARAGLRPAVGGGQGPQAGDVQLPRGGPERPAAARARALGCGEPAWPLVRGRPGPRGDATRVFRLGRIAGPVKFCGPAGSATVPDGTDVRELVRDWDSAPARAHGGARVRTGPASACGGTRSPCADDEPRAGTWSRHASATWAGSPTTPPRSARMQSCSTRRICARP